MLLIGKNLLCHTVTSLRNDQTVSSFLLFSYSSLLLPKEESVSVTRDELHVLADISERGELEEDEEAVIHNLLA